MVGCGRDTHPPFPDHPRGKSGASPSMLLCPPQPAIASFSGATVPATPPSFGFVLRPPRPLVLFVFFQKRLCLASCTPPTPPPTHPHLSRKAQESEPNALPVVVRCHGGACHHHHHTAHCLSCFFLAPLSLVVGQHMPGLGKAMATGRPRTRHGSVPLCTLPAAAVSHTATVTGARGNARCTEPWLAVGPLGAVVATYALSSSPNLFFLQSPPSSSVCLLAAYVAYTHTYAYRRVERKGLGRLCRVVSSRSRFLIWWVLVCTSPALCAPRPPAPRHQAPPFRSISALNLLSSPTPVLFVVHCRPLLCALSHGPMGGRRRMPRAPPRCARLGWGSCTGPPTKR